MAVWDTELGKAFYDAKDRSEQLKMNKVPNQIGEEIIKKWNPKKFTEKHSNNAGGFYIVNPYAEIISKEFDKMVERVIPANAFISARFQNWINKEHNELIADTKISKDNYLRSILESQRAENEKVSSQEIMQGRIGLLQRELNTLEKSFKNFMDNNPQEAFASKETLEKWNAYYKEQQEKVKNRLETGNFSDYDRKNKDNEIVKMGTEADAIRHQEHIAELQNKIQSAQNEQSQRVSGEKTEQSAVHDYLQDTPLPKINRQK